MTEHDESYTDNTLDPQMEDKWSFPDPRQAIALACLKRTIRASVLRRLLTDRLTIIAIEVPGADWVRWVEAAAQEMLPGYPVFTQSSSRGRKAPSTNLEGVAELVAKVGGAIAIIEKGEMPEEIDRIADHQFTLSPPDPSILREVARRILKGDAAKIRSAPDQTYGLNLLAACFPRGGSVGTALARLRRLSVSAENASTDLPALESVQGLDAAKEWGMDLKIDLAAYRAGQLPFSAIEAGAILAGPPGTGKTMVAGIIARECGIKFVQTSIGTLFATSDGHLGAVIKKFRSVFDEARQLGPSLLFIDELDALPSRETLTDRDRSWWTPLITDFLIQLDSSLNDRAGVVVLGATNRYQDLEPALVRPGRLSRLLQIEPLSAQALAAVLRHHLGGDLASADLVPLAMLTKGATGAAAAEWVSSARRTVRNAGRPLQLEDLWDAAIGRDCRTPTELWRVAVHEAGHCVLGHVLGRTPTFVTIRRVGNAAGHTRFDEAPGLTRGDLERAAIVMLGGHAAEREILGGIITMGTGGRRGSDLHLATEVAAQGHASFGWGDALVWRTEPKNAISLLTKDAHLLKMVEAELRGYAGVAETLIRQHAACCRDLATILMAKLSLSGQELEVFLSKLPPPSSSQE